MPLPEQEVRISSAAQLRELLGEIKTCLAVGTLRQVTMTDTAFANNDISTILDEGPWPDYFEAYFEDRQGTQYRLAVETYHGAGGSWSHA
jgi:hypothetical protein